jgi:hypothetical protein
MQLKMTVDSQDFSTKSGIAQRTGKPYSIREQSVLVELPNGERRRMAIALENDEQAMALGEYTPKQSAFYFAKYGIEVAMRARHWQRIEAAAVRKVG